MNRLSAPHVGLFCFRRVCLLCVIISVWLISQTAHALTIRDDTGRTLTLNGPAQRIVSLAPSITENLFAIGVGARIVGTSASSDFPHAAQSIPLIGDYQSLDLERIAALKPDVIVAWQGGNSTAQIAALERLNIPVYFHRVDTLPDIPLALMRLAQLTGTELATAPIILKAYQQIDLLKDAPQPILPTFYQVWSSPLMTLGRNSWVTDALARCGARNIFADLPLAAPTVNIEDVLKAQPAIFATATPNGIANNSLDAWKKWTDAPANRIQGFIFIDDNAMNRATLRTLSATRTLCAKIADIRSRF
ncbi:cobalamin-binding protein [Hydromonas duriensis]|nr:cobalamin-binding protein [Hydromonas duriensis]